MEPKETLFLLGFRKRTPMDHCATSGAIKKICRTRASKRWSALLTQTRSRIGHHCGMRKRLGEVHWAAFVRFAEAEFKPAFFHAFAPSTSTLCCEGRLDGSACPKHVCIDLKRVTSEECAAALPSLHMDHTHDVSHVCKVWSDALPEAPRAWDDGICGPLVAHLLFGVQDHLLAQCSARGIWRRQLIFRCGNKRGDKGQNASDFCHDVANAHYDQALKVSDVKWPAA